ncbi:MAG: Ku protein [Candidatus Nanopelagicales bacterium]
MRAMWSGNVTFGLVHVPVKLYAATEDHDIRFHQVHLEDGGRIKYKRECSTCGQVVAYSEIGKGFEDATGRRVIMTDADLDELPVAHSRDIEIVEFVPVEQIDPMYFDRAYYLEPNANAAKPYVLLRQALAKTDRMAVVQFAMRQRTRLGLLRVRGDVMVLQTMLWPDEVRVADFAGLADDDVAVRPQELAMAGSLVESLSSDFDPESYKDEYREAVKELVARKLEGEDVILPPAATAEADDTANVVDLMSALQESVRRTQAARAGGAESDSAEAAEPEAAKPVRRRTKKDQSKSA